MINKLIVALVFVLLFVGMAPGWQVYLLAGESCGPQPDFRGAVPVTLAEPNGLDPVIYSATAILPPVGTDALTSDPLLIPWEQKIGKLNRTGSYCVDPNYILRKIECVTAGSSSLASITVDPNARTWTLAASVYQGPNWWLIHAVEEHKDDPSVTKENSVLVLVWGDAPQVYGVRLF